MIYDLAYEIADAVKKARQSDTTGSGSISQLRKSIYLAEATSDLRDQRENLRREFLEQGHLVYPDRSLPNELEELETAVQGYLDECDVIVQLIGGRYGFTPEGADESVIVIQNRLARPLPITPDTTISLAVAQQSGRGRSAAGVHRDSEAGAATSQVLRWCVSRSRTSRNCSNTLAGRVVPTATTGAGGGDANPAGDTTSVYLIFEERERRWPSRSRISCTNRGSR
ncbi:MAG: hypothetical protein CM1200mP2_40590 [Planctomycetaceae bacterium]|nr:MAG: hypothetical protein CM1200mP2_40590 [Planctomycetaceae bacterium]